MTSSRGPTLTRRLGRLLRLVHRVEAHGLERVPSGGRLVLAMNHVGVRGGLLLAGLLPRDLVFLASGRFLRFPLVRALARRSGAVFVSPLDMLAPRLLERAGAVLDTGALLGVMVEGRQMDLRKIDLRQGRPKRGAAYLAARLGADLLPVRAWLRGPRAGFEIGEPVPRPAAVARPVLDAAMAEVVLALGGGG